MNADMIHIIAVGLIGGVLSLLVRNSRPEFSIFIPAAVTISIMIFVLPYLRTIISQLRELASESGLESDLTVIAVKAIGVSYIASVSAELCKDAGENAIAAKIELGGKLIILGMSMPIIERLLILVKGIIEHG